MSLNVFKDTFIAEKNNKHGKFPFSFIILTVFIPAAISYLLVKFNFILNAQSIATLINVLAIFIGFLIAALVPYFEIAANALGRIEKIEVDWEVMNRRKLFKIIFPSIILSITCSLFSLIMLIFLSLIIEKQFENKAAVENLINVMIYFFLSSNFLNVFNLTRRTSALVLPVLEAQIEEQ